MTQADNNGHGGMVTPEDAEAARVALEAALLEVRDLGPFLRVS